MYVELWNLFSVHYLMMLYIRTRFRENISEGFRVIERTRFVTDRRTDMDELTDGQTTMG